MKAMKKRTQIPCVSIHTWPMNLILMTITFVFSEGFWGPTKVFNMLSNLMGDFSHKMIKIRSQSRL